MERKLNPGLKWTSWLRCAVFRINGVLIRKICSGGNCEVRGDSYCPRRHGLDYGESHTLKKLGVATQAGQVNMLLISLVDKQGISAQMQFAEVAPVAL